jgi:hypothetical protein
MPPSCSLVTNNGTISTGEERVWLTLSHAKSVPTLLIIVHMGASIGHAQRLHIDNIMGFCDKAEDPQVWAYAGTWAPVCWLHKLSGGDFLFAGDAAQPYPAMRRC